MRNNSETDKNKSGQYKAVRVKGGMRLRNGMWERHNYAEFNLWQMAQRNKLNRKACARLCQAFFRTKFEGAIARLKLKHS